MTAEVRYGVFLGPDARTSAAVTDITRYVRAQFGLVSASRFPPHLTLAGSLPLAVEEADLLAAVDAVAQRHQPVEVVNRGVRRLDGAALFERTDLRDEVEAFIGQLAVAWPGSFVAERVAVYRQHHPDWADGWWTSFRWQHLRSFRLGRLPCPEPLPSPWCRPGLSVPA